MQRPRLLAVAQSAQLGGAERALLRLAERLPAHGFEVTVTAPDAANWADEPLAVGGLRRGAWPRALVAWPRARSLVRGADVVLLNGVVAQRLAPAMTTAALVPYVHELVDSAPRSWRSQRVWRATPLVMCACAAVAERCRALGVPGDRLRTVYVPVEDVEPGERPPWAANGPVVGFVGRLEPAKGVLDLVRAMRDVEARLVLVGAGSGAYADQVREEAGPRVRFAGEVGDARPLMHWFDVLAVPSRREAFGTVAAEALSAGTPVVATRGGGIEEYVVPGRNGALVPPGDVGALAAALHELLPHAASMESAARESVHRFDADAVSAEVAALLHEAVRRRTPVAMPAGDR